MAMNKKEQAAMDAALEEIRIMRALRWSDRKEIARDVLPPVPGEIGERFSDGWDFNTHYMTIQRMWSSAIGHGYRDAKGEVPPGIGAQRERAFYSTRALALKAMRCKVERDAAEKLAQIDAMIEAEGITP